MFSGRRDESMPSDRTAPPFEYLWIRRHYRSVSITRLPSSGRSRCCTETLDDESAAP